MKSRTAKFRLLAFLLVLCMVVGPVPVYAVAEGEEPAVFEVNETKSVTLALGETCSYTFTPDEDGTYILYRPTGSLYFDFRLKSNDSILYPYNWDSESATGIICYRMKAGVPCQITINNNSYKDGTVDVTLIKATETESVAITSNQTSGYVGDHLSFGLAFSPEFGGSDMFRWSISDESIATYAPQALPNSCYLELLSPGTVVLTATSVEDESITASIEVTVKEWDTISVGETKEFDAKVGDPVGFIFTAESNCKYIVRFPNTGKYTVSISGNLGNGSMSFDSDGERRILYDLKANDTLRVVYNAQEDVFTKLTIEKGILASDIEFQGGDSVVIPVGEYTKIPIKPIGGNYSITTAITSSDSEVAGHPTWEIRPSNFSSNIVIFAHKPGTATITLTAENDITKTLKVTVVDPNAHIHELVSVDETAATCTSEGMMAHYKCVGCSKLFRDAEGKNEVTAAELVVKAGHKLEKVAAVAPTYDAAGNVEYHKCSACGKLFADADGKTETTAEAVVLAQLIAVEEGTAVVTPEAVDKAVSEADSTGEVTIDVTKNDSRVAEVELPVASLETLVAAEKPLSIVTNDATVILDTATMTAVAEAANGNEITIRVEQINTQTLNKKQQEAVADHTVLVTISANIYSGDTTIGDFKDGKATVKVPLKLDKDEDASDYSVFFLDEDGNLVPVESFVKNNDIYFVIGHFSDYVILKTGDSKEDSSEDTAPSDPVDESKPEDAPADPDLPNTGDEAHLGIMVGLLMFSIIGLAVVARNGKKYA